MRTTGLSGSSGTRRLKLNTSLKDSADIKLLFDVHGPSFAPLDRAITRAEEREQGAFWKEFSTGTRLDELCDVARLRADLPSGRSKHGTLARFPMT